MLIGVTSSVCESRYRLIASGAVLEGSQQAAANIFLHTRALVQVVVVVHTIFQSR